MVYARPKTPELPIDDLLETRTVILSEHDREQKRIEILEYFHKTFTLYESLSLMLSAARQKQSFRTGFKKIFKKAVSSQIRHLASVL